MTNCGRGTSSGRAQQGQEGENVKGASWTH